MNLVVLNDGQVPARLMPSQALTVSRTGVRPSEAPGRVLFTSSTDPAHPAEGDLWAVDGVVRVRGSSGWLSAVPAEKVTSRAWWWGVPKDDTTRQALVAAHDVAVLTPTPDGSGEALRNAFQAAGVRFPSYMRFEATMREPSTGTWLNQAADRKGDFASLPPTWFLLDANGNRIPAGKGDLSETEFFLMDPGSAGWRGFLLDAVRRRVAAGWDGVFFDNVELSLAKRRRSYPDKMPAQFPTDAAYSDAVLSCLEWVRQQLPRVFIGANLIETTAPSAPVWHRAMGSLNSGMIEGFGGWDEEKPFYADTWTFEQQMLAVEQATGAGKHVLCGAIGTKTNTTRWEILYAAYLLVASATTSFRYASGAYGEVWDHPMYRVQLGEPQGPRTVAGGVHSRVFAGGTVTVNPSNWAVNIPGV